MLLKSSSTPVLGSLLSSFSESPSSSHYQSDLSTTTPKHPPISCYSKLSYPHSGSQNFSTVSCNSSPISPAIGFSQNSFRRAQSEGNLEGLVNEASNIDEFSKKFARRPNSSLLESIPSFSYHNLSTQNEDEYSDEEEYEEINVGVVENDELFDNQCFVGEMGLRGKIGYGGFGGVKYEEGGEGNRGMYLARGLGVADICFADGGGAVGGGGDGGGCRPVAFDKDGGDSRGLSAEEHYRKMVEENPGNSLVLRNYAQFLYQIKRDLEGAEEYYSRAILADPSDGEVLSHYAKLMWELHHDKDRAINYFDRAIQAASEDSHVHAAYASFLWEVEDEDLEETSSGGAPPLFNAVAAMTFVAT